MPSFEQERPTEQIAQLLSNGEMEYFPFGQT